ncbi:hypothetical protein LJB42_000740, partial [Komagataella kurtzmanii]
MNLFLPLVLAGFFLSSVITAADIGEFTLRVLVPSRNADGSLNVNAPWVYTDLELANGSGVLFSPYSNTSPSRYQPPNDDGFVWASSNEGVEGFLSYSFPGYTGRPYYASSDPSRYVIATNENQEKYWALDDTSELVDPSRNYCFEADYEVVPLWFIASSIWTGTETSWTTAVGGDGSSTVIELVPTPSADTTSIWTGTDTTWTTDTADTTSIWTGSYATWTTDVDGSVIEQIPTVTADETTTWTGSYTTWTTGEDGSTIAVVPSSAVTDEDYSTSTWTGTFTTYTTDEDGSTIAVVPSPTIDSTSTWTGSYTTWITDSDGSNIVICPSITSDHNDKPSESTLTDGSISTAVVTVTSCGIEKCTKTTALTGVTETTLTTGGTTTVVTTYCPLPTDIVTVKTTSISGSEVLQTIYTAKPNDVVPDAQTLTVTITRE